MGKVHTVVGVVSAVCLIAGLGAFRALRSPDTPDGMVLTEPELLPLEEPDTPAHPFLLRDALADGVVSAAFTATDRTALRVTLRNHTDRAVGILVPEATVFECGDDQLVTFRPKSFHVAPGTETSHALPVLATSGRFQADGQPFLLTGGRISRLAVLIHHIQDKPEVQPDTVRAAALVLTENLPLSAFARFDLVSGDSAAAECDPEIRTDTRTIILALQLLKDIGVPTDRIALLVDPQLLIESMIDPLAHAPAIRFYEIPPEREWEFWKAYLQYGDTSTRHYALHGIGRHFPEVAVNMLGQWARADHLDPAYRLSAIQALARTGKVEALSVLAQLRHEYAHDLEMEVAIHQSSALLTQAIYDPVQLALPADFRFTPPALRALIEARSAPRRPTLTTSPMATTQPLP